MDNCNMLAIARLPSTLFFRSHLCSMIGIPAKFPRGCEWGSFTVREFHIEAFGPKNRQNAVLWAYTAVLVHHRSLLKPSRPSRQNLAFLFGLKIMPKTSRDYDGIVIARMDVWRRFNTG